MKKKKDKDKEKNYCGLIGTERRCPTARMVTSDQEHVLRNPKQRGNTLPWLALPGAGRTLLTRASPRTSGQARWLSLGEDHARYATPEMLTPDVYMNSSPTSFKSC